MKPKYQASIQWRAVRAPKFLDRKAAIMPIIATMPEALAYLLAGHPPVNGAN